MGNSSSQRPEPSEETKQSVLGYDVSVQAIVERIRRLETNGEAKIVVMAGAGISVSAGIPGYCDALIKIMCS